MKKLRRPSPPKCRWWLTKCQRSGCYLYFFQWRKQQTNVFWFELASWFQMFFGSNLFFTSLMNMRTSLCLSNVVCFPTCVLPSHEIFVSTITKRTQTQNETTYTACSNTGIQFYQDEIMCIPGGMTSSYNCAARARRETRGELILGIPRAVLVF